MGIRSAFVPWVQIISPSKPASMRSGTLPISNRQIGVRLALLRYPKTGRSILAYSPWPTLVISAINPSIFACTPENLVILSRIFITCLLMVDISRPRYWETSLRVCRVKSTASNATQCNNSACFHNWSTSIFTENILAEDIIFFSHQNCQGIKAYIGYRRILCLMKHLLDKIIIPKNMSVFTPFSQQFQIFFF